MQRARSSFKSTKPNNLTRSKVISYKRNVIELEVDEEEKDDVVGALLIEKDIWMVRRCDMSTLWESTMKSLIAFLCSGTSSI